MNLRHRYTQRQSPSFSFAKNQRNIKNFRYKYNLVVKDLSMDKKNKKTSPSIIPEVYIVTINDIVRLCMAKLIILEKTYKKVH